MIAKSIFTNWKLNNTNDFKEGTAIIEHSLHETDMFSDQALIQLIEKHPAEFTEVFTMSEEENKPESFREGNLNNLSGEEILGAVKKGRLWLQLAQLHKHQSEYDELIKKIIAEMKKNIPRFKVFGYRLSMLISSPNAQVFYHADIPRNALWQIRGKKRVYLYPLDEKFISRENLEGVFLGETMEDVPYQKEFDQDAEILDLEPGKVVTWPQNGAHRVVNHDCLNVSLAMEYFEPKAWLKYGVYYANGVLRRRFGIKPREVKTNGLTAYSKFILAFLFKIFHVQKAHKHIRYLTFNVDPLTVTGFRDTKKVLRESIFEK